ncbi:MAG: hypothetical protein JW704_06605, partial [Anaerolineaceae bacterium]|nr:hypothetical protein [Anaerolineaceae bacterium]
QQVDIKASVRKNVAEFNEGTRASRFRNWARQIEAEAAWRDLGRRHGSKVDVTQDPNVRRLIEKGIGPPSSDLAPKPRYRNIPPELAGFYETARKLNIPDRVTEVIVKNLGLARAAGIERAIDIELKLPGGDPQAIGRAAMKRAAMLYDELLPYKPSKLKGLVSDESGIVIDPEKGKVYISDPDLWSVIDDGRILSNDEAMQVATDINDASRGGKDKAFDPFPHSHMATCFTVEEAMSNPRVRNKAANPPDAAAIFTLDSEGSPVLEVKGRDAYVDRVAELAYQTNLSEYPWALSRYAQNPLSTHAKLEMVKRGITPAMVDTAIRRGTPYYDFNEGTIAHVLEEGFASGKHLYVSTNPSSGLVTTVIRRSRFNPNTLLPDGRQRWIPVEGDVSWPEF